MRITSRFAAFTGLARLSLRGGVLAGLLGLGVAVPYAGTLAACSEDTPEPTATPDGGELDSGSLEAPALPCTDTDESLYGAMTLGPASDKGKVLKCFKGETLTKEAMQAKLTELGKVQGGPLTSGAKVYKVAYQTQRGDTAGTPGMSAALVYIPEVPRAAKLPIIVGARGSRGQAARCALSKLAPDLPNINDDLYRMAYTLVGRGYAVIVPDLAGYSNYGAAGNPPSAYAQANDVGRSTLDGARALKQLFPVLDDKVVLVGHSQGGHSALAALSLADSYGTAGPIIGAAVYAPLWLSQRSWGAILFQTAGKDFPLATSPAGNVSVWYHYTQAELLDGPGEGKKLFKPEKQAAVENFINNECWGSKKLADEAEFTYELFDTTFVSEMSLPAATGAECSAEICSKWVSRYVADRPHLTGSAAKTPILLAYGLQDTTIPPNRMRCALDRLAEDKANVTSCVDADQDHGGIVGARGEYVADWIANIALGAPAPAPCAANASAVTEACATPPPND